MNKVLLAGVAALAFVGVANAADLGRPVYKAPPPVAAPVPVFTWAGCYIGAHGGYGWGKNTNDFGHAVLLGDGGFDGTGAEFGDYSHDTRGGVAGGQIGCNYQVEGNWVFGVEVEGWWSGMKGSVTTPEDEGEPEGCGAGRSCGNFSRFESRNRWDVDVAARFGWSWGQTLLYGKVGVVWGGFQYIETHDDFPTHHACGPCSVSIDRTQPGVLLGVGLEYAFAPNWSAKIEYDYLNFFSDIIPYPSLNPGPFSLSVGDRKNIVKVGLNYRFGWSPSGAERSSEEGPLRTNWRPFHFGKGGADLKPSRCILLQRMSPLLALLRHRAVPLGIPLLAAKRTCRNSAPRAGFDPERTFIAAGQRQRATRDGIVAMDRPAPRIHI